MIFMMPIDATMVGALGFTIYKSKSSRVTRDLDVSFHLRRWACSNGYCTLFSKPVSKARALLDDFPISSPPFPPNSYKIVFLLLHIECTDVYCRY